jgi:hypothetical protein
MAVATTAVVAVLLSSTPAAADDGGLPVTGSSPVLTAALGSLFIGIGLSALLVRKTGPPPGRRRGTGRRHP